MAELEDAPWAAKKRDAISVHPVDDALPDAPWAAPQPGLMEDLGRAVTTGPVKGVAVLGGLGGDLQGLAKAGAGLADAKFGLAEKAAKPFGWMADKFTESFPNAAKVIGDSWNKEKEWAAKSTTAKAASGDIPGSFDLPTSKGIQGAVEKVTGPLKDAQTPVGKAVQTGLEIAPSLLTGGEGLLPTLVKSASAGAVSEGAGEMASALKGHLPDAAQPWAEPVARAVGAISGSFTPAGVRQMVTPLPLEAERAATIAALKAKDPNFPMTAGQQANSPGLMGVEGRAPKFKDQAAKQEEAFTRGTMQEMGVDGLATPENIARGKDIGDRIGNIRRGNLITPAEFPQLNQEIAGIVRKHAGTVGADDAALIKDLQKQIRLGAANSPNVLGMTGARYDYMRQKLQSAIEKAPTGTENKAISDVRTALDNAFHRSVTPAQSAELKQLETQYANYNVLKNKTPTGSDTVTPKDVSKAVASGFGNAAVNENRGTLAPWARNASKVMQELPAPSGKAPPSFDLLLSAINSAVHGSAAGHYGGGLGAVTGAGEGWVSGHLAAEPAWNASANLVSRALASGPSQAYLKNQLWKPGQASTGDAAMIARLLMSPPERQLLPSTE